MEKIICTNCGIENDGNKPFCTNCGVYLIKLQPNIENGEIFECPNCSKRKKMITNKCENCGWELINDPIKEEINYKEIYYPIVNEKKEYPIDTLLIAINKLIYDYNTMLANYIGRLIFFVILLIITWVIGSATLFSKVEGIIRTDYSINPLIVFCILLIIGCFIYVNLSDSIFNRVIWMKINKEKRRLEQGLERNIYSLIYIEKRTKLAIRIIVAILLSISVCVIFGFLL